MQVGDSYTSKAIVTESMLAKNMGSGDLAVLATPSMIALMENASMLCVAEGLPDGSTTVGGHMDCSHLHPTAQGETIEATSTLMAIEGRKLTFKIQASDAKGIIGEGTHIRFIIDRERFMAKL